MTAAPPVVIASHTIEGTELRSGMSGTVSTTPDVVIRVEFSFGDGVAALRALRTSVDRVTNQIVLTEQARP